MTSSETDVRYNPPVAFHMPMWEAGERCKCARWEMGGWFASKSMSERWEDMSLRQEEAHSMAKEAQFEGKNKWYNFDREVPV